MRKRKKRLLLLPLVVFSVFFLGLWWLYGMVGSGESTFVVVPGTVEDKFTAEGVFIRHETVVTSDVKGTLQSTVKDGEKVAKGEHIAVLYKGSIDSSLQGRLDDINSRIAEVKANGDNQIAASDIAAIEAKISDLSAQIAACASAGDQSTINRIREDLDRLVEKKSLISGQSGPAAGVLDRLIAEKQQLESQIGQNKTDIIAPCAGVFSIACDGYEKLLSPDNISAIKPGDVEAILNAKPAAQQAAPYPVCRIVDNSEWILAVPVQQKDAEGINSGDRVAIRFTGSSSGEIDAWVEGISQPQGGKVVLFLGSTQYAQGVYSRRTAGADIIKHRYTGLKIPVSALTKQNGKDGAMVRKGTGPQFKEAAVLYKNKDYAIIKEDNKNPNSILLYDEVVFKKR